MPRNRLIPVLICLTLLGIFVILAWTAARRESPTYDETYHAASGYAARDLHDYRIDPESSLLWKYWLMLPHGRGSLSFDDSEGTWAATPHQRDQGWRWCNKLLYRTAGNDGASFIQRSRAMMLVLGVALGALICLWSWKLGGSLAAVTAGVLFALDPNLLAHAPLVKNDVPFALALVAAVFVLWLVGRDATWPRIAALCVICGIAINVKFSALMLVPLVAGLLIARALSSAPWRVIGRELNNRTSKALGALAICVVTAAVSYLLIWATYGFRFAPTPDPSLRLDTAEVLRLTAGLEAMDRRRSDRPWKPDATTSAALFLERHELLPQPFLYGFLYTRASAIRRPAFLLGERQSRGWAWYFPLAMAFKTPLATMAACAAAGAYIVVTSRRNRSGPWRDPWTRLCLLAPVLIYGLLAINTRLNLGLRHVLPIYPFLYVVVGVVAARLFKQFPRRTAAVGALLAIGLAIETLAAYPHYIPFFNAPCAAAGRIKLLGDSNLDWGQDLPLLAEWQRKNPDRKLYLSYFGTAHPAFYGIRYTPLQGGDDFTSPGEWPRPGESCVVAISATHLQGIYLEGGPIWPKYQALVRGRKPMAVLGHSIYLFEFGADGS